MSVFSSGVFSCAQVFFAIRMLVGGGNGDGDGVGHARPLENNVYGSDAMGDTKLDGMVAVPEVIGVVYVRTPAVQRFQVQRIFRILNQDFHTREVHVHCSDE